MSERIDFNFDKKKAGQLLRKAIGNKVAICADEGDFLKVGTPPFMLANIDVHDNYVEITPGKAAGMIASTCATAIRVEFEEYEESIKGQSQTNAASSSGASANSVQARQPAIQAVDPEKYLEYQEKVINIIKQFKELLKEDVITQEEFDAKKAELLNFMKGMTHK